MCNRYDKVQGTLYSSRCGRIIWYSVAIPALLIRFAVFLTLQCVTGTIMSDSIFFPLVCVTDVQMCFSNEHGPSGRIQTAD